MKLYVRLGAFVLIVALYSLWPNARADFTKFNAHDSEAYLALAYSLANGFGYTRNMIFDAYIPHTTWPPGLPILLLPAITLSGDTIDWMLVKYTMIFIALCGIVLTWFYVNRIARSPDAADAAALFVALNPYYWHFSRIAMAEVPVIAFCIGALYLVDLWWVRRDMARYKSMILGLVVGSGMLLKGVVAGLVLIPLTYVFKSCRAGLPIRSDVLRWIVYALAFCVPFGIWTLRNNLIDTGNLGFDGMNQFRMILASVPTDPISPLRTLDQVFSQAWDKARWFFIYRIPEQVVPGVWALSLADRPWGPYAAVALTLVVGFLAIPRDVATVPLYLVALPMVCLNVVLVAGGSERYWIPPMILLGVAIVVQWAAAWRTLPIGRRYRRLGAVALLAVLLMSTSAYIREFLHYPYGQDEPWKELAELFDRVEESGQEADAVYTPNGSAFSLITGLPAPMTMASMGIAPKYTHIVTRADRAAELPAQTDVLLEVRPWVFAKLPVPLTEAELQSRPRLPTRPGGVPGRRGCHAPRCGPRPSDRNSSLVAQRYGRPSPLRSSR